MRKLWKAFAVVLAVLLTTAPAATAQTGQWSEQARVTGDTSHGQSVAWFRNTLYVAAKGANDGVNWSAPVAISSESSHGPALAEWNGRLYLAYRRNIPLGRIWLKDSPDGQNWGNAWPGNAETSAAPALAGFHGKLFLFWKDATSDAHHYKYGTDRRGVQPAAAGGVEDPVRRPAHVVDG